MDYTDWVASPSYWLSQQQLTRIAEAVHLSVHEREAFRRDADRFLHTPCREADALTWIEHPSMSLELDRAWEEYVGTRVHTGIRTAAILSVFANSPIARQISVPPISGGSTSL